jgi:hypothetical protein
MEPSLVHVLPGGGCVENKENRQFPYSPFSLH